MKIAIVGSRNWTDEQAVIDYVNKLAPHDTVISGGARGVDTFAEHAARRRGLEFKCFPANRARSGTSAGFRRNAEIVAAADRIVAFWAGSLGTAHTIRLAQEAKKPVDVFYPDGTVVTL